MITRRASVGGLSRGRDNCNAVYLRTLFVLIGALSLAGTSPSASAQPRPISTRTMVTPTVVPSPTPTICPSFEDLKDFGSSAFPWNEERMPGHGSRPGYGDDYLHFGRNCHNAANAFARRDTRNNGIVLCNSSGSHQLNRNSEGGHTFNWRKSPPDECGHVQVCLYNWTNRCCFISEDFSPVESPNLTDYPAAVECVKQSCSDQYKPGNPVALPAGMLVEDAGWLGCVKTAAGGLPNSPAGDLNFEPSAEKQRACEKCCAEKATLVFDAWTPPLDCLKNGGEEIIRATKRGLKECQKECEKYFAPPAQPTNIPTRTAFPTKAPA